MLELLLMRSRDVPVSSMGETSWWRARGLAAELLNCGPEYSVPLSESLERTLSQPVRALVDLPGFATAAMDGWVVSGVGPWEIVGTIDTGSPAGIELSSGCAMRIATGGAIPDRGEAVIPWEMAKVDDGRLVAEVPKKLHIRPRGEECVVGDLLASPGDRVSPVLLGSLAAAGVDTVSVYAPPSVSVLVLGNEVITSGLPGSGQVRDALGVQLPGWLSAMGAVVTHVDPVADDPVQLQDALAARVQDSDFVVATGGTARGHRDFLRSALEQIGAVMVIDGVTVRPGHPMMLAHIDSTPIVGLPGNPLSALVALVTLIEPMIESWFGRSDRPMARVHMAEAVAEARKDLTRLMVGRRDLGGFRQVSHVSSAMLRGLAHADGWAVVPPAGVTAGDVVPWIPVPWMRRTRGGVSDER